MNTSKIRMACYNGLVNAVPGISYKYHKLHDNATGLRKAYSWGYLLCLNMGYHILRIHKIGVLPGTEVYEEKKLPYLQSESEADMTRHPELNISEYISILKNYDVISFDMFDTLIFRPFEKPTDLYYLQGEKLGYPGYKDVRISAEAECRRAHYEEYGNYEVTAAEISSYMTNTYGESLKDALSLEITNQKTLCYANPFMLKVWNELLTLGKKLIVTTDMYLPEDVLRDILVRNGFNGYDRVFLSCVHGRSKADGLLYNDVKSAYPDKAIIHVGDNRHSDIDMAKRAGLHTLYYPRIDRCASNYRAYDMSYIIGSAYRGIVSNHLYNGSSFFPIEYEYGFIYGGLFVTGYCHFIHEYYVSHDIDKILFLSRDGDILKKAYDYLYPSDNTEYVYWSRKAGCKLMAAYDRRDYLRRFIHHKINRDYTIRDILASMELPEFIEGCPLSADERLNDRNSKVFCDYILSRWDEVLASYTPQVSAAEVYFSSILDGCHKAAAIDIGWAGSGPLSISYLAEKVWRMPCEIYGILAGTNTIHNIEPDASEPFLQSGRLTSYMFSSSLNRDVYKKHSHMDGKDFNVYWELLLSSPTPAFDGFYPDGLHFGAPDANTKGIEKNQEGILDFVHEYSIRFREYPYMFNISGRDAYAPFHAATGNHEKYLKEVTSLFDLRANVE